MSQRSEGWEGSTLIGTLSQIFSIFYFDASPKLADLSLFCFFAIFFAIFCILSQPQLNYNVTSTLVDGVT